MRLKICRYLSSVLILLFSYSCFAQFRESENIEKVHRSILYRDSEEASFYLEKEKNEYPGNLYIIYYDNYSQFISTFLSGDPEDYNRFKKESRERIHLLRKKEHQQAEYLHFLSVIYLQSTLLNFYFNDGWSGSKNFYHAYRMMKRNIGLYPDYSNNLLTSGIFELFLSSIPAESEWFFNMFGLRGDHVLGLNQLKTYYDSCDEQDKLEALLILGLACYYYEEDKVPAYNLLTGSWELYQDNPLFRHFLALAAQRAGNIEHAIDVLRYLESRPVTKLVHSDLLMGELLLSDQDSLAGMYLKQFLENYHGLNLTKTALHKLSWFYYLLGEKELYEQIHKRVLSEGEIILEQDRQAFAEASDGYPLNEYLLNARILYDGGKYQEALNLLSTEGVSVVQTEKDNIEYPYRLGRIYHGLSQLDEAIPHYQDALAKGMDHPFYFAPYSALQLAYIAESKKEYLSASRYYQICLDINTKQYRSSIGIKAKTGLKRIQPYLKE